MMQHMATGVPSENTARRAEEIMPLPYWSAPMSAAAEPVISSGTLESAAALEHAAIIPFVLNTKNMGMAIPHRPSIPVSPSASSQREKSAATCHEHAVEAAHRRNADDVDTEEQPVVCQA